MAEACSHHLRNILKRVTNTAVISVNSHASNFYFRYKQNFFSSGSLYQLQVVAKKSDKQLEHLYAIPYARYCILRDMTKSANEDANNTDSNMNDLYLINGFQQMMASNHAS